MSQYFAAALTRLDSGWDARELDLSDVSDAEEVTELLRDLAAELDDPPGPVLLFFEEDDEYVAVLRVDGDTDARVFLSDVRAIRTSALAALLAQDAEPAPVGEDEDDEGTKPEAEPVGEPELLADLGTSTAELLELCNREGLLPADVIAELCRRAGCADELELLRDR